MKSRFALLFVVLLMAGCSSNLVHTWNIDKYEIIRENGQNTKTANIGTITFNKDGTGTKNINYTIFQSSYADKAPFKWKVIKDHGYILLQSTKKDANSRLAKAWIIVENHSKKQVWKSTDGKKSIQVLVLSRK